MLYPQNGDRIVTIDSVTSLRPSISIEDIFEWRKVPLKTTGLCG